jgi:predicted permease
VSSLWRILFRRPSFAIPSIAGLAIAIAAATAVFSVFSALELDSMGFRAPGRLAAVWLTDPGHGQQQVELSFADWREWRKIRREVADVALASSVNLDFTIYSGDTPEHVDGTIVTGNFFSVLGASPLAGRLLGEDDDRPGAPARVVLSHRLWRSRFGADFAVIGREIRLGSGTATVIGVARPEFDFPREVDLWAALYPSFPTVEQNARLGVFRSVARLAPGVSIEQARVRLDAGLRQSDAEAPAGAARLDTLVKPIRDEAYGAARVAVAMLGGAVLLLLLIACANAANLTLAMHAERAPEIAVRAALGAGRWRLVRLLVAESAAAAAAGGVAGLLAASLALDVFARFVSYGIALAWPVALVGLGLTAATVLLFGAGPALFAVKTSSLEGLGGRSIGGRSRSRACGLLIAAEVALSAMLAIAAGLLARSFSHLAAIDPGYRPEGVLTFRITTELADQPSRRALYTAVLERLRALPGVDSAAAVLLRPLSGAVGWDTVYTVDGQSPAGRTANPNGNYEAVSPGYFRTMRIPLVAGRDFTPADHDRAAGVVIVNRSTARRHWPNGGSVGRRIRLGNSPQAPWLTVVGVVADVRYREWESPRPDFYVPYLWRAQHRSDFVVRAKGDPWALAAAVRQAVFAVDKSQPISNLTTMGDLVDKALARARLTAWLIAALAFCATGLAAIGIYGLLSWMVRQRTREIGVRTALGARPPQVARLVAFDVLRFVGAGLAVGVVGAAGAARTFRSQFFEVSPFEPSTYAMAVAALALVAIVASALPAWRASTIDPAAALRSR